MNRVDKTFKHMYTKAGKYGGYIEYTYHGSSIIKKYDLSEYKDKISLLNIVR